MNNTYLIPANSKKSKLIFGVFAIQDLIIFGIGVSLTFILLLVVKSVDVGIIILILLPSLISGFLVMPIPNYHNVRQLIKNAIAFIGGRKRYFWKGWCIKNDGKF